MNYPSAVINKSRVTIFVLINQPKRSTVPFTMTVDTSCYQAVIGCQAEAFQAQEREPSPLSC